MQLLKVQKKSSQFAGASRAEIVAKARVMAGQKERRFIEQRLKIPISKLRHYDAYMDTSCKKVWATFRAMHLCASVVTSTAFKVVTGPNRDEVNPDNNPLLLQLESPNPFDSWTEMTYQWTFHVKGTGNAYWLKDLMDARGRPKHVYPLLPQYVEIIPDETEKVAGYVYKINGEATTFEPDEIIHFRRPHPKTFLHGMGDIEPSVPLYEKFINRDTMEERFMENGAQPSGILVKKDEDLIDDEDEMDEGEWGRLKKRWQANYGGKRNVGKTAFLQGDWDYIRLGLTSSEMESIEREKFSIQEIFMNHGVPLTIAGFEKAANYATARIDQINFRAFEIKPLLDILVDKLNGTNDFAQTRGVYTRAFNDQWRLAYDLSGLVDVEQVTRDYLPAVQNAAMTPNQFREKIGEDPDPNPLMNTYYMNGVPLEMVGLQIINEQQLLGAGDPNNPSQPAPNPDDANASPDSSQA